MEDLSRTQPIHWESRKELGFFKALIGTAKQIVFKPVDFFSSLEIKDSILDPFLFYFVIVTIGSIIPAIFNALLGRYSGEEPATFFVRFVTFLVVLILTPLFVAAGIFIWTAILHLFVMMFKGQGGFRGTFNALCYSCPPMILSIVPFIGWAVGSIWYAVLIIISYKHIHNLSTGKAVAAYIIPFIILMLLAAIVFFIVVGALLLAEQGY